VSMAGKHAGKAWLGVCLASLLTACSQGDGFADLDKFMADTRAKPPGHVEPLPEIKAYEAFSYSAADRRAPFEAPVDVPLAMVDETPVTDVEPDLDRQRDALENFAPNSLAMVGTLEGVGATLFALVRDDAGGVHRVRAGNY